ncbi:unnamed protein product [Somion occarium]|uniref:Vacuolar protein sorting-associated protein 54 C-terminal domain-containing protein n=1 Tax=Somion occarium TaxID=3059160 RepID=A0ABP1DF68_9APHY
MSDYASSSSRPATPVGDLPNFASAKAYRFNWDAGNRKGPGSISETTEGRGDYFASNAVYDLYNTSATSLTTSQLPSEWSSTLHGFHAISTVVNSPHKRSAPPKAHSSLPAVSPADLPRVRRKDFDAYLRSVAPEWERFQQNAEQGREGVAQVDGPSSSHLTTGHDDVTTTPRTPKPPPGRPLPPLESVPDIYFDPKFNLGDPQIFNAIMEYGDADRLDFTDPLSLEYSQPVLDNLSHYADTIEQHLVREISLRSTSFFAALSNLQDLQSESEQCLDRISHLRGLLKEVDEKGAKKGLVIVRKENQLKNLGIVKESVKVVSGVIEMTGVAKSLVNAGQWGEALDVIDELQSLWDAHSTHDTDANIPPTSIPRTDPRSSPLPTVPESPPVSPGVSPSHVKKPSTSVPISSLQAFAALPSHLRELTLEITSSLTSEVVNVLRLDLLERIDGSDKGRSSEEGMRLSLKDKLRPLLHSLARTNGIREVTLSWKEVVVAEVRSLLKRRIPAFDFDFDDPHSNKGAETAKELRSMTHLAFMELAREMYHSFLRCIEGLQAQSTSILDVLEAIRHPKSTIDLAGVREDLSDILSSAGELANGRAGKVVNVRSEQHTNLDLPEFYTFFTVSWDFVVKSEVICKRMIVALRGVIVSQAKTFLQAFHQTRISQSAKLVEDEQWNPAEVIPPVQRQVDMLVDASIRDPREFLFNPPPAHHVSPLPPTSPGLSASPTLTANGSTQLPSSPLPSPNLNQTQVNGSPRRSANPSKHLKIEDRNYFAVGATLEVLLLLVDYLKVIMNLPMLTTDTMSRVIELLKAFNSRTCQVVLGAGAMRSAGLKNITAKHLALASQSLSIMISLIPYVRETFRRHLNQKQAVILIEFDKLKRDYQEHQNEIHAKLIAIMGDRLTAHIRSLQSVRWDLPPQRQGVNEYMELLVKETVTLHKVLSRYLSPSIVEYVMSQVFAAINHRLSEEYTKIELPSQEAKERLLADARYLIQKLSGLKNVGAPTAMLEIIISEKSIARKAPPPNSPALVSTPSRLKGMLGRADSLRKAPATPMPQSQPQYVPEVEKAVPLPTSPTPLIVSSISPSPSPQPPSLAAMTVNSTFSPPPANVLDQGTSPGINAIVPDHGNNVNGTEVHDQSSEQIELPKPLDIKEHANLATSRPDSPPPPTPEKDPSQHNGIITGQPEAAGFA